MPSPRGDPALHGGASNKGTVFKINGDGTGFGILHSFTGTTTDGAQPFGTLTVVGSTLYGTTGAGGANNLGVVFQAQTDGSNFSLQQSFAGGTTDGSSPEPYDNQLAYDGSNLYGMTQPVERLGRR